MKSQDRRDLKKNELAENLEKLKKIIDEQGSRILAVVVLVAVIIGVVSYVRHTNMVARQQAMEQLLSIHTGASGTKPDDVKAIAEQTSDKKIASLAWKIYGDQLYSQYVNKDKNAPKDVLEQAEKAYQIVITNYPAETLAVAGSELSLATLYEDQGKWAEAGKLYKALSENTALAGTGLSEAAKAKLNSIATLEKSAQQPLATTQPATISAKPSTSSTSKLAK